MNQRLIHRGPDEAGLYVEDLVGLAMRRLRVIDLEGGAQPITNEDGTCRIVYNGEVYNYRELREGLLKRGHRFASESDTETILHLYEEYGERCVDHLNGMFAFAIHDSRDDSVFIARDRIGIKPLYYAETPGGLVFGSEIKAILTHPDVSRDLDPVALDDYLTYKFIPAPRTIYSTIKKLLPGHWLKWQNNRCHIERYWSLSFEKKSSLSDEDLTLEFESRFSNAVASQMIADVPLGAFLSGGLDSSMIVSEMVRHSDRPIQTFSIGFDEPSYNEQDYARIVATHFGTHHHELIVRPNVSELLETITGQFDEPFGDSSAIPAYLVSDLARQHVTVALSGTGADELFAGYERYWAVPLSSPFQAMPSALRRGLASLLGALPAGHGKRNLVHRASRFIESQGLDTFERHARIISVFGADVRDLMYTDSFSAELAGRSALDAIRPQYDTEAGIHDLDRLLGLDTRTILPDDYLTKDDRMSMATSLELRVPFLDHTLVEFAATCPAHLKLRRLETKVLMRRAAAERIPKQILDRPKHGFEVPIAKWIGLELGGKVDDLLLSDATRLSTFLNGSFVRDLVDVHRSGKKNNSREIWSLMSLEMWLRAEADGT
jgi:asparagine synthase (glutamine-hydrolysing)